MVDCSKKNDVKKVKDIIAKYPDRIPVHLYISKRIEIVDSPELKQKRKSETDSYVLLKALCPKEMKMYEFISMIRTKYTKLHAHESIYTVVSQRIVSPQITMNEVWYHHSNTYKSDVLEMHMLKENTFG